MAAGPLRAINSRNGKELAGNLSVADTRWRRLKGLLGERSLSCKEGLWIRPCSVVHTFGMSFPVDLVFLNRQNIVISAITAVPPNRLPPIHVGAYSLLALPVGRIAETGTRLGDLIAVETVYVASAAPSALGAARTPSSAIRKYRSRYSHSDASPDTRRLLLPVACSLCFHMLLVGALAAEWQARPDVVWVSTLLTADPVQVSPAPELSEVKPPGARTGGAEVPTPPKESDEQQKEASFEPGEPSQTGETDAPEEAAVYLTVAGMERSSAAKTAKSVSQPEPATFPKAAAIPLNRSSSTPLSGSRLHMERASESLPVPPLAPPPALSLPQEPEGEHSSAIDSNREPSEVPVAVKVPEIMPALLTSYADAASTHKTTAVAVKLLPGEMVSESFQKAASEDAPLSKVSPPAHESRSAPRRAAPAAVAIQPDPVQQPAASPPSIAPVPATLPVEKLEKPTTATLREAAPIFEARVKGDLELYLTGGGIPANEAKVMALFRAYPKNRHNTSMSINESKKVKVLAPKTSRTGVDTVQAVIEIAPDGIYEFRGAADIEPQEASCSITVHGTSSRPTVKQLGTRTVGNDSYILKILMPEGILWDDDANFSGSIKGLDSTTKFNLETGLTWKEYN